MFLSSIPEDANKAEQKEIDPWSQLSFCLKYPYESHTYSFLLYNICVCVLKYIHLFKIYKSYTVSLCYVSFTKLELYFPEFTCMYVSGLGSEKFAWDVEDGEDAQPFILCFEIWCRMPVTFNPWMLSANCWFTLVVRSPASGPAASPECPGLFASASLIPGWARALFYVKGISFSRRSLCPWGGERDMQALVYPCSSLLYTQLFQLTYRNFRPHIRCRQGALSFYITRSGPASLVALWPLWPAFARHCAGLWG